MYILVSTLIAVIILLVLAKIYQSFKDKIKFYVEGIDRKFSFSELSTLWKTAEICNLENPSSIFISMNSLSQCIAHIKLLSESEGTINSARTQNLLSRLYTFRNNIEKEADKKRGLESSKALANGQKLRVLLPGKGVFSSEIVNNGKDLIIKLPTQKNQITVESMDWLEKSISVYLWRKGDARYVFDTKVNGNGSFMGKPCLFLSHSSNLIRSQKRSAIRAKCHIYAQMYIITEQVQDLNYVETKPGYKCLLEDISEKGALIRIGGKGVPNIKLRIQFQLEGHLIVMHGEVRTVEYNNEINQSRLHFECTYIDPGMKNQILSFVFNILPEKDKKLMEALQMDNSDDMNLEEEQENEEKEQQENEPMTPEKLAEEFSVTDEVIKDFKGMREIKQEIENDISAMNENDDLPVLD